MNRLLALLMLAYSSHAWANIPPSVDQLPDPKQLLRDIDKIAGDAPAAVPAPAPKPELTQKDLMAMTREQIETLYKTLPAGPIPDGDSKGRATLSAGSGFGAGSEKFLAMFWQGKIFHRIDEKHGELVNKILGKPAIKAEVYFDKSRLDGKESIILDYSKVSDLVVHGIRDEIRMAAPGLYIGFAYRRRLIGTWTDKPLIFALDFNKKD
ncbi:MAG: hypothetical protein HY077_16200 [Elusimicrobia bacterium]|nr:hypothetical protein [Elusimicrobiota bacterium]